MREGGRVRAAPVALILGAVALASCTSMYGARASPAGDAPAGAFAMGRREAVIMAAAAHAAARIARGPTPEQEYRIGRTVAANILSRYPAGGQEPLDRYLNLLGQGLALHSPRPELFAGYRFLSLSSDETNAFSTPGGHILVTYGLLRLTDDEDELAAVLAHEIAHASLRHGMDAIQGSRVMNLAATLILASGRAAGPGMAEFTEIFGRELADNITALLISGYSQAYEFEADRAALEILASAGYDPRALLRVLSRMRDRMNPGEPGFAATHPEPSFRLEALHRGMAEGSLPSLPHPALRASLGRDQGDDFRGEGWLTLEPSWLAYRNDPHAPVQVAAAPWGSLAKTRRERYDIARTYFR